MQLPITRRIGALAFSSLIAALCVCFASTLLIAAIDAEAIKKLKTGDSVIVTLETGGSLSGSIDSVDPAFEFLRLKTKFGTQKLGKDQIKTLERILTAAELYEQKSKACKSAEDWLKLGKEMELKGDSTLAEKAYEEGLKVDANYAGIHEQKGEIFDEEKKQWVDKAAWHEARGDVLIDGKYVDKEKAEQAKKEAEDRLKNIKLKGQKELEKEYIGRPWAAMEPVATPHYDLYCDSTEDVAKGYAKIMDALYAEFSGEFSKYTKVQAKRGVVKVHRGKQEFMDWYDVPEGVGGFYRTDTKEVHAYHGTFGTSATTYEVLAHEGTHQFQGFVLENFYGCPNWVIEGQAVFYGDGSKYNEKTGGITTGLIPRDRLENLQDIIQNNAYDSIKADRLMMATPPFPGYYYAPAWGVIFWCMRGHQQKVKAHNGEGVEVFSEFFKGLVANKQPCDYPAELARFKKLMETKTGKSFDVWEKEYAEWIMQLSIEKLMRKKGEKWESDALNFSVKAPSGWKEDKNLRGEEQIAFLAPSGKHRRISSFVTWNYNLAELSVELAETLIGGAYAEIEWIEEASEKTVVGFPAVEAIFTGKRIVHKESAPGGAQQGEAEGTVQVRAVIYATVDRVRMNLLETDPAEFDSANAGAFAQYLKDYAASD